MDYVEEYARELDRKYTGYKSVEHSIKYTDDDLEKYQHYINAVTPENIDKTIKALKAVEERADSIKNTKEFYYKRKTTERDYLKRMSDSAQRTSPVWHQDGPYLDDEDEYI